MMPGTLLCIVILTASRVFGITNPNLSRNALREKSERGKFCTLPHYIK